MEIIDRLNVIGSSQYLDTDDYCIYVARNPFWADQQTNEVISKVKNRNAIAVNMVDAEDYRHFQPKIFKYLIRTIHDKLRAGQTVNLICNKGTSRSGSIALLYLAVTGEIGSKSFKQAKSEFLSYYPDYRPTVGIETFLEKTWNMYFHKQQ